MSVNVGILGVIHPHTTVFAGEWVKNPEMGVKVVKCWDRNPGFANHVAPLLGAVAVEKIDDILNDKDIGAVVIASETKFHAELAIQAAAAGKAIAMYKPMALTLEEADRIVAAVEKYNVPFTLGYWMRVDPQNIKIKQLITDKTIGDTYVYRRRHGLSTHTNKGFENSWHVNPELNRDIFADDAAHPIDMLNWIFGVPETVMAEQTTMHHPKIVNDNGIALFKYKSGMIAEISNYFTCSAAEISTEVYGPNGSIQQYYNDGCGLRLSRTAGSPGLKWFVEGDADWTDSGLPINNAHADRIAAQGLPLAEFLTGKRPPICNAREGRDSLRMLLACYLSAQTGERVRLDDERIYGI